MVKSRILQVIVPFHDSGVSFQITDLPRVEQVVYEIT